MTAPSHRAEIFYVRERLFNTHKTKNTRDSKGLPSTNDLPVKPNKHRESERNRGCKNKARPDDQIGSRSNDDAISGTGRASTLVERMGFEPMIRL